MKFNILNIITGLCGSLIWIYLVRDNTEQAVELALGILLMLIGFGGRDTIIDIIKSWKG